MKKEQPQQPPQPRPIYPPMPMRGKDPDYWAEDLDFSCYLADHGLEHGKR